LAWKLYAEATDLESPLDIPSADDCIKKRVEFETNHTYTKATKVPKPSNQKTPPSDNVDEINKWVNDDLFGKLVRDEEGKLVRDELGLSPGEVWLSVPSEVFGKSQQDVEKKKKNFINGKTSKASIVVVSTYGKSLIIVPTASDHYKVYTHKPSPKRLPYIVKEIENKQLPVHDLVYKAAAASTTTFSYVPQKNEGETIDHTSHKPKYNVLPALFPAPPSYQNMNQKITTRKLPEGVYDYETETQNRYAADISFKKKKFRVFYYFSNHRTKEEAKLLAIAERRLMEIWRYFEVERELEGRFRHMTRSGDNTVNNAPAEEMEEDTGNGGGEDDKSEGSEIEHKKRD